MPSCPQSQSATPLANGAAFTQRIEWRACETVGNEQKSRRRFARCCLLPSQVSNCYSFAIRPAIATSSNSCSTSLSNAPRDVGIIVTSVSSNVGLQTLLFNKLPGAPGTNHLAKIANATTQADFFDELQRGPSSRDNHAFVAWQLERYLVLQALLSDGRWLGDHLERRAGAARGCERPDGCIRADRANRRPRPGLDQKGARPLALARNPFGGAEAVVHEQLDAIWQSTCWTMTAPLRIIANTVRRRPRLFGASKRA
jgi:hypothetical protein